MWFFLLFLTIPPFHSIDSLKIYEQNALNYLNRGMTDSARKYIDLLDKKARNQEEKKKAIYLEYTILKSENDTRGASIAMNYLLSFSNKADSVIFLRDLLIFLYNNSDFESIKKFEKIIPPDDTTSYLLALYKTRLGDFESALNYLEKSTIAESKILQIYILYALGKYREVYELGHRLNWPEILIISSGALGRWDSLKIIFENYGEVLSPTLYPYLQALYILSMINLDLRVPEELFKKWLTFYGETPLRNFISFLYAKELNKRRKWNQSEEIIKGIDTTSLFKDFPDTRTDFHWMNVKNIHYLKGSIRRLRASCNYITKNVSNQAVLDSCKFFLGSGYFRIGNYNEAIIHLKEVTESSPFFNESQYLIANSYFLSNQPDEALKVITKTQSRATDLDFKTKLYEIQAKIYENKKEYSKAINTYRSLLALNPPKAKYYEILYQIEMLKYKSGQYESIDKAVLAYVQNNPESPLIPQCYYDLLFYYIYTGKGDKAREMLNELINKYPNSKKTIDAIELYFGSQQATLKDTTFLKEFLESNPKSEDFVYYIKGIFVSKFNKKDEALQSFSKVKAGEYYQKAQLEILKIYYDLKKYNEVKTLGLDLLQEEIKDFTSYKIVEVLLSTMYENGETESFDSMVNRYISKEFPFKKDMCLFLANTYLKGNDTLNALKYLMLAKNYEATDQEIIKYNPELLKLIKE